jgi:predicted PurR-regulated permease PerM
VMIPIILAVLLSFLLAPVASFLRRLHLGRVRSALLAVMLALGTSRSRVPYNLPNESSLHCA